jgi:hypothetical protein
MVITRSELLITIVCYYINWCGIRSSRRNIRGIRRYYYACGRCVAMRESEIVSSRTSEDGGYLQIEIPRHEIQAQWGPARCGKGKTAISRRELSVEVYRGLVGLDGGGS